MRSQREGSSSQKPLSPHLLSHLQSHHSTNLYHELELEHTNLFFSGRWCGSLVRDQSSPLCGYLMLEFPDSRKARKERAGVLAHSKQALGREIVLPQPLLISRSTLSVSLTLPLFV